MRFENTEVFNFESALRGMRNPMNSWSKSDSYYCDKEHCATNCLGHFDENNEPVCTKPNGYIIGENDLSLAQKLILAGSEHRKFMRQIFVSVDITAPLYWWKEFDTYKVGVTANSTSTMHKLTSNPITIDCFEIDDFQNIEYPLDIQRNELKYNTDNDFIQMCLIPYLEYLRIKYLETKEKKYWKELIRWLPESWLQTRTVTMTYENVFNIVKQRGNHKLNEWSGKDNGELSNFMKWAKGLPYANELIFYKEQI